MTAAVARSADQAGFLRRTLVADAAFSVATGSATLLAGATLAEALGIPSVALIAAGVVVVGYAVLLMFLAQRPVIRREAMVPIVLDALWVIGSVAILASGVLPLTAAGFWTIAMAADVVAVFGILKVIGLRRASGQRII